MKEKLLNFFGKIFKCKEIKAFEIIDYHKREEQFTKCDQCEYLDECMSEGRLIPVNLLEDLYSHYILGCGSSCPHLDEFVGRD